MKPTDTCGCPITYNGNTVHRIRCPVRIGKPVVFPPSPAEVLQARRDIWESFTLLESRAKTLAARGVHQNNYTVAELDRFLEWAKQRLHVIALARAVLPSDDGKENPSDG